MERRALQYSMLHHVARSIQRGTLTPAEATEELLEALQYTTTLMKEAVFNSNPRLRLVENDIPHNQPKKNTDSYAVLLPEELTENHVYLLLSPREKEIFWLRLIGKPNREIAEDLCITPSTVQTHITHICEKLKINIRDFTRHAYDNGLNPTLLSNES
jgi:DNA-binding CsgD family transcriptional regulator